MPVLLQVEERSVRTESSRAPLHSYFNFDINSQNSEGKGPIDVLAEEFADVLNSVAVTHKMNGAVFKDEFFIFLSENWKPWPDLDDELFKRSFIVCLADNMDKHSTLLKAGYSMSECKSSKKEKESAANNSSDYTGSPLDYVFDVTDVFVNDKINAMKRNLVHLHHPLAALDANYLTFLYKEMIQAPNALEVTKTTPMFIYCDGKDLKHVILLGVAENCEASVRNGGTITEKTQFPTLSSMIDEHLKSFTPHTVIETSVYSQYDVTGSCVTTQKTETLKPTSQGLVSIECTSSCFKTALEKPSFESSCVLLVQAVAGNENEGAHNRFKELQLIKILCNSLVTGEISWPNKNAENGVLLKLQSFLDGLKQSTTYKIKEDTLNEPSDFDSTFLRYVTSERNDLDFTDHLWLILQDCNSYESLVEAFTFCFNELKNFPFLPVINRTNTSTVGKIIRNMGVKNLALMDLDGEAPLKLLLEIGVEKLMKDYVMIFVGLEMVPYDSLVPYLRANQLHDTDVKSPNFAMVMDEITKCLEKFHTVEEMLIILWSYLKSSKAELNGFVRMVLRHYASVPAVDSSYVFKFPISLCGVKHIVGKNKPLIWQASLKSRDSERQKQTVKRICRKLDTPEVSVAGVPTPSFVVSSGVFISTIPSVDKKSAEDNN